MRFSRLRKWERPYHEAAAAGLRDGAPSAAIREGAAGNGEVPLQRRASGGVRVLMLEFTSLRCPDLLKASLKNGLFGVQSVDAQLFLMVHRFGKTDWK